MVAIFLAVIFASISAYLALTGQIPYAFYATIFAMGVGLVYSAEFVTIAAEQFGTNIRATVATSVPNFVRGAIVPITLSFEYTKGAFGIVSGAAMVCAPCLAGAVIALYGMEETHGKDLDYHEII